MNGRAALTTLILGRTAPSAADAILASEWLAEHDAEVRAEAWDEGHRRGYSDGYDDNGNGYDAGADDYVPLGNPYRATATEARR